MKEKEKEAMFTFFGKLPLAEQKELRQIQSAVPYLMIAPKERSKKVMQIILLR